MSSSFGKQIVLTISGKSRGESITAILDGIPAGVKVSDELISRRLSLRRPDGILTTSRIENDEHEITSGIYNGITEGTPICITIKNSDAKGEKNEYFRPSHADYTAYKKYDGNADMAGGGFFSGRMTSLIVVAGVIAEAVLAQKMPNLIISSGITKIGCISDDNDEMFLNNLKEMKESSFPVSDKDTKEKMINAINEAKSEGDSLGGVVKTAILGLPVGVGEPFFDSLESVIAHGVFSIPGVKGISFGDGFALASMKGSQANDGIISALNTLKTESNHSGGINGGISNGNPIVFSSALRPTPTISIKQNTVSVASPDKQEKVSFNGRNDPCFAIRASHAITAITELAVLDLLYQGRII